MRYAFALGMLLCGTAHAEGECGSEQTLTDLRLQSLERAGDDGGRAFDLYIASYRDLFACLHPNEPVDRGLIEAACGEKEKALAEDATIIPMQTKGRPETIPYWHRQTMRDAAALDICVRYAAESRKKLNEQNAAAEAVRVAQEAAHQEQAAAAQKARDSRRPVVLSAAICVDLERAKNSRPSIVTYGSGSVAITYHVSRADVMRAAKRFAAKVRRNAAKENVRLRRCEDRETKDLARCVIDPGDDCDADAIADVNDVIDDIATSDE